MKKSAGILLYKFIEREIFFFLVHPGGPYFSKKEAGWWTLPKGEPMPGEEVLNAAIREFTEETGYEPKGTFTKLEPIVQKGGKTVHAWACEDDFDVEKLISNSFEIEWPPKTGKLQSFPEIDKAGWFNVDEALVLINERQQSFVKEVCEKLS